MDNQHIVDSMKKLILNHGEDIQALIKKHTVNMKMLQEQYEMQINEWELELLGMPCEACTDTPGYEWMTVGEEGQAGQIPCQECRGKKKTLMK